MNFTERSSNATSPSMEYSCRLCGIQTEGIRVNIFEPDSDHVKKIHKILPITVSEYDPFPKTMCHRCSFKVNDFYDFRIVAIQAQEQFKSQIPWLKDKQGSLLNVDKPPMVRCPVSTFDTISPTERETEPDPNAPICIDDDSPPPSYEGDSETSYTIMNNCAGGNVLRLQKKGKKKTRRRSIWDTKQRKRKKKNGIDHKITEVFTSGVGNQFSMGVRNGLGEPEKDPLSLSPDSEADSNLLVDENTETTVRDVSPLSDDMLPDYILVTQIPSVGEVYTCERCGRTLLVKEAAFSHKHSPSQSQSDLDSDDRRTSKEAKVETEQGSAYSCDACNISFTRRSQLKAHARSHYAYESSSDEKATPPASKRRRKTSKKKKSKLTLLPPKSPLDSVNTNNNVEEPLPQSQLMRHLILSSDSD